MNGKNLVGPGVRKKYCQRVRVANKSKRLAFPEGLFIRKRRST